MTKLLDALNAAVTDAILRAEMYDKEACEAWKEVAKWEAALTEANPEGTVEREIAKRGYESALLKANPLFQEAAIISLTDRLKALETKMQLGAQACVECKQTINQAEGSKPGPKGSLCHDCYYGLLGALAEE